MPRAVLSRRTQRKALLRTRGITRAALLLATGNAINNIHRPQCTAENDLFAVHPTAPRWMTSVAWQ